MQRRIRQMVESPVVYELQAVITRQPIDEVLVSLPIEKYGPLIEAIVRHCEEQGIIVRVRPGMSNLQVARSYVDELEGVPVVTVQSGPEDGWQFLAKRLIDIFGSAAFILLLAPIFAMVALLIRFDSPGPVFFTQDRIGLNKRPFRLLKF